MVPSDPCPQASPDPSPGALCDTISHTSRDVTTNILSREIRAKEKLTEWTEKKKREIKEQLDRERIAKEQAEKEKGRCRSYNIIDY